MDVHSPLPSSPSESHLPKNSEDNSHGARQSRDGQVRREQLLDILGEANCRKLGLFRIPETLTLSVVIPVYDERATIHEILQARACRSDQEADHRG